MASINNKPEYLCRNIYCIIITILSLSIFLSIFCNVASASFTGQIISVTISPSTLHPGDSVSHTVIIQNTGSDELPINVEVYTGGAKSDWNTLNYNVSVGKTKTMLFSTVAPSVPGQITYTYKLYYDRTWPTSDLLLDTETKSVTVLTTTPLLSPTGSLSITSSPSVAGVYIDGSFQGITPVTVSDLTTGSHTIRITRTGYNDYTTTAAVYAGQTTSVTATLIQIDTSPSTGSLYITSSPSGADVYVDLIYKGITTTTLSDIPPGSHSIRITKTGYNEYWTTATVISGKTATISANLIQIYTPSSTGSLSITSSPPEPVFI